LEFTRSNTEPKNRPKLIPKGFLHIPWFV
jgi:hypothetical protein